MNTHQLCECNPDLHNAPTHHILPLWHVQDVHTGSRTARSPKKVAASADSAYRGDQAWSKGEIWPKTLNALTASATLQSSVTCAQSCHLQQRIVCRSLPHGLSGRPGQLGSVPGSLLSNLLLSQWQPVQPWLGLCLAEQFLQCLRLWLLFLLHMKCQPVRLRYCDESHPLQHRGA